MTDDADTPVLPAGSWDTHCHIFGPASRFPWAEDRTYTPDEVPFEALDAMHRRHGIEHAVIVQPACHGTDNSATLDGIARSGGRYRGIALIDPEASEAELRALDEGGIRGVRMNFVSAIGPIPSPVEVLRVVERIAPLGWQLVVHLGPGETARLARLLGRLPIPVVIDHMARFDAARGLDQPDFAALLDLAPNDNIWIKISGADRASAAGAPWRDAAPFMAKLIDTAPDRLLWGTDWPHPNIRGPMPEEADLIALLREVARDEAMLRTILVDNPARLYGR